MLQDAKEDLDVIETVGEHDRKRKHRDAGPERSWSRSATADYEMQRLSEMRHDWWEFGSALQKLHGRKLPVNCNIAERS